MPVTARLSKKLYDTLGEDIAHELVEWFNQMDTTFQSNLKELNELNFQRFDAKLEQRLAEFNAKLEQRLAHLETKWEERIGRLEVEFAGFRESMTSQISVLRAELIKWMFLFWLGTVATMLGFVSLVI